jgi:hypothetical protein
MLGGTDLFRQLKALLSDVYNIEAGEFREQPKGIYELLLEDKDRLFLANAFAELVVNTDYFSDATRELMLTDAYTAEDVSDSLYRKGIEIKTKAVYNWFYRDKKKFREDVGGSFFGDLVLYKDNDVEQYKEIFDKLLTVDTEGLMASCALNIRSKEYKYEVSDEDFEKFIRKVRPYSKKIMDKVQKSLDKDVIAYIHYITTHEALGDIDKERLKKFQKMLMGG